MSFEEHIIARHHKPTSHHRWLLLMAGLPVGADWLDLKRLWVIGLSHRFSSRGCRAGVGFVLLGGGFVVGAMCSGVPACNLSFSVCVVCVCRCCVVVVLLWCVQRVACCWVVCCCLYEGAWCVVCVCVDKTTVLVVKKASV